MTKIMLVEDDKNLRDIYGVRLFAEGYDIVSAGDGEEALAMAIKERPKLIISDVMMPKISGFDMLDILRSTTETKEIKVIMMTALSSDDQRQRGESLGADRYVVKSQVGIEDVVRIVHEVLGDGVGGAPAAAPTPASPQSTQAPTASGLPAAPAPTSVSVPPRPTPTASPQPAAPQTTQAPMPPMPAPTVQSIPVTDAAAPVNPAPAQPPANPILMPTPAVPTAAPTPAPNPTGPMPANISHTPTPGAPAPAGFKDRVIQPLPASQNDPLDINALLDKELAKETLEASAATPTPPTPPQEQPPTQPS